MQNLPARRKPTYSIEAVDNALQLLQLLRDVGSLRLKDAAAELGVAPSTAHRLLAMLVYRGFAVQDETRRYVPGPAMGAGPAGFSWTRQLRDISRPHMEVLCARTNETVNLMIRVGTKVRFLDTVESSNILRVGDRQGTLLPAHKASGGKAILAELARLGELLPIPRRGPAGPARLFRYAEGRGRIGVIPAVSQHFCGECNRLRITADGRVWTARDVRSGAATP